MEKIRVSDNKKRCLTLDAVLRPFSLFFGTFDKAAPEFGKIDQNFKIKFLLLRHVFLCRVILKKLNIMIKFTI